MGYFANGTEGLLYEEEWCQRCIHFDDINEEDELLEAKPCAVWEAHLLYSYQEANNPDSVLNMLIPLRDDGLGNEKCQLFRQKGV